MGKRRKKIDGFSVREEIIFHVLKELPVKCLLRLRCVSKLWCSIIDDPFFIHSQHTRSHTRPGGISTLLMHKLDSDEYEVYSAHPEGRPVHHLLRVPSLHSEDVQYVNGLIRIANYIWNPTTRESTIIPPMKMSITSFEDLDVEVSGSSWIFYPRYLLGFDPYSNKYKVLSRCSITSKRGNQSETRIEYKILTLGTNMWRSIDDFVLQQSDTHGKSCCISGVIYSLATISGEMVILAFEVGREKFQVLPHPQGATFSCRLIQVRERLALVDPQMTTIWILQDYERKLWNRESLVMMYEGKPLIEEDNSSWTNVVPFGTIHTGEILLQFFNSRWTPKLFYYDLESKTLRMVKVHRRKFRGALFYTKHVESLFRLKGGVSRN